MTRSQFVLAWRRNSFSRTHCFYCGREFRRGAGSSKSIRRETVEHIIPQHSYKGGPTLINNTVGACAGCNNGKNGDSPYEFREWFGQPFFCEIQLNQFYPVMDNSVKGDGTHRIYYGGMVETWHKQIRNIIDAHFDGKALKGALDKIRREAQCKTKRS